MGMTEAIRTTPAMVAVSHFLLSLMNRSTISTTQMPTERMISGASAW